MNCTYLTPSTAGQVLITATGITGTAGMTPGSATTARTLPVLHPAGGLSVLVSGGTGIPPGITAIPSGAKGTSTGMTTGTGTSMKTDGAAAGGRMTTFSGQRIPASRGRALSSKDRGCRFSPRMALLIHPTGHKTEISRQRGSGPCHLEHLRGN